MSDELTMIFLLLLFLPYWLIMTYLIYLEYHKKED